MSCCAANRSSVFLFRINVDTMYIIRETYQTRRSPCFLPTDDMRVKVTPLAWSKIKFGVVVTKSRT